MLKSTIVSAVAVLSILAFASASSAQAPAAHPAQWEFRVPSGAFLPTGDQGQVLANSHLMAVQLSWVVRPQIALTGTIGWARSRDIATVDHPKLDVFDADIGVEARSKEWFAEAAVSFAGFVGVGAGARSYDYRSLDVNMTHNLAGYASAGGELGVGRVGVRLEVRDYVAGFRPLIGGGDSATRNDVAILASLSIDWD